LGVVRAGPGPPEQVPLEHGHPAGKAGDTHHLAGQPVFTGIEMLPGAKIGNKLFIERSGISHA
jgi:hypothetical protein